MLNAAKHLQFLIEKKQRGSFAEFILSGAYGLRKTTPEGFFISLRNNAIGSGNGAREALIPSAFITSTNQVLAESLAT